MGRVVCGTPAARAERIGALPNIKKIPVQGLAVPRTELREGGAEGTGEEGLFGIDGGRGRVEESVGGETVDRRLDCFGVEGADNVVVGAGRGNTVGEEMSYGWGEFGLDGGFNGSGA